jgi:hypothetical protein
MGPGLPAMLSYGKVLLNIDVQVRIGGGDWG